MARGYRLTVRSPGSVQRTRHDTLVAALAALERRVEELRGQIQTKTIDLRVRKFEPVQQVAIRAEIGDSRRIGGWLGGVDVRGDGSEEAYVGRPRRLVQQAPGESAAAALARTLRA